MLFPVPSPFGLAGCAVPCPELTGACWWRLLGLGTGRSGAVWERRALPAVLPAVLHRYRRFAPVWVPPSWRSDHSPAVRIIRRLNGLVSEERLSYVGQPSGCPGRLIFMAKSESWKYAP